jgi:hypothetical protein
LETIAGWKWEKVMEEIATMRRYLEERQPLPGAAAQMVAINSFTTNSDWGQSSSGSSRLTSLPSSGFRGRVRSFDECRLRPASGVDPRRAYSLPHRHGLASRHRLPAAEEETNDFRWREAGERIYGPGTVDIKGGTMIMYMILDAFRALAPDFYDDMNWVLLLDASEETDGVDFGAALPPAAGGPSTLACLIFEGGLVKDGRLGRRRPQGDGRLSKCARKDGPLTPAPHTSRARMPLSSWRTPCSRSPASRTTSAI